MKYKFLTGLILLAALLGCRRSAPPVSEPSGAIVVADRLSNQRVNAFAEDADGPPSPRMRTVTSGSPPPAGSIDTASTSITSTSVRMIRWAFPTTR